MNQHLLTTTSQSSDFSSEGSSVSENLSYQGLESEHTRQQIHSTESVPKSLRVTASEPPALITVLQQGPPLEGWSSPGYFSPEC